ncbi:sigma-70 family RNA polymerase sigma factor [Reichenbachiella sp. MALMAid0571]|uniref:RNA polymerase sigma factor n=1 Tax=Reichenbachiella sp. MALMAid0571 TaxID=3143939 RepID=UPI0032DFAFEB
MAGEASQDLELWEEFKQGESKALDKIYMEQFPSMYSYGLKIHNDHDFIIDSIQELFAELWAKRESLGEASSIKFYLLKSIKRKIIKKLNRLSPTSSLNNINERYNFEVEYSIEHDIILSDTSVEQSQGLIKALNKLSDRQREIIYLRFYLGLKFEQISEIMSIKNQSARNLLFDGVSKLKAILISSLIIFCIF